MTEKNMATIAGAGVGAGFGPDLVRWWTDIVIWQFAARLVDFPPMPEAVLLAVGGAVGALLVRWWWGQDVEERDVVVVREDPDLPPIEEHR